jgi:hypothetical protein
VRGGSSQEFENHSRFGSQNTCTHRAALPLYLLFPCRLDDTLSSPSPRQAYPIRDSLQLRWADGTFAHSFLLNDSEEASIPEERQAIGLASEAIVRFMAAVEEVLESDHEGRSCAPVFARRTAKPRKRYLDKINRLVLAKRYSLVLHRRCVSPVSGL